MSTELSLLNIPLPILQWAGELPQDAADFLADLDSIPVPPPFLPTVDPIAASAKVLCGAYDRFQSVVIVGTNQAHATHAAAVAHYKARLEAHKIGDGTLLSILLKNLPLILQILKGFGLGVPTLPTA